MSNNDPSMIKRSTFVPWNPINKVNPGPEPSRIVSDIIGSAAVKASAVGFLSNNPRIQAAQSEWERKSQAQSLSRPSSTGPVKSQKRESPSDIPPAKKHLSESEVAHARETARRFTEDDVARQLAELESASIKKSAMYSSSQPTRPVVSLTGAELMAKYTGQTSSPTPAPPAPAKSPDVSTPDHRLEPITMAEPGRQYNMFPDPNKGNISARGALIPANYQLHNDPNLPYICPVRDCRKVFGKLASLGGHFGAGHCSSTFNDNGDGTLSKVGSYQRGVSGGMPGIVVSRNPLPPNALPPAEPGLSVFASFQQSRMSRAAEEKKMTRSQDPTYQSRAPFQDSDVKSYLHQLLSPAQISHHREDVDFMLTLPRRRDLPESWKLTHRGSNLGIAHYACAVAYLTGKAVTGGEQCTARIAQPSARLSQPCIALPPGMPQSAKEAFSALETCVGCRYWSHLHRLSNGCDWCPEPKLGRGSDSSRSSSTGDFNPQTEMELDRLDEEEPGVMAEVKPKRKKRRSSGNDSFSMRDRTAVGIISAPGQMGGVELEMEDWEVAPGRMTDESSSDNIAFSNSYLTSGQPVTVSEDVSFNVMVLKPGSANHWTVEDDKLRTCSVASGKIRVTMNDKTFNLGPNGLFVVRPGQTCKVENRLYVDSVVHCTTIEDFSLQ
ncbi:hypothetical protein FBEOM_9678 [Fusarium beomiforme]|uniref:C2H2-type domain-containing protein n=1 Tax=Fusarium beomiforme TaxID=44412 RepID=A0A9P5ACV1_9HYPO|nr:hypothetical protein FBEOM_9678 [Fusarium beomiforme]